MQSGLPSRLHRASEGHNYAKDDAYYDRSIKINVLEDWPTNVCSELDRFGLDVLAEGDRELEDGVVRSIEALFEPLTIRTATAGLLELSHDS